MLCSLSHLQERIIIKYLNNFPSPLYDPSAAHCIIVIIIIIIFIMLIKGLMINTN